MSEHANEPVSDLELLASWEGQAKHAPGVLFEETAGDGMLAVGPVMLDFANWVAGVAVAGVIGNAAFAAIKAKVLGVLAAWRRKHGQTRLDELKQQVFEEANKHRPNGKLTEEELKSRIDTFFAEIQG
jgi:hypothetical protein